jgi:hypothetical protein
VLGIELEVLRRGSGRRLLAVPGFDTIDAEARSLDLIARHGDILAPSEPGFGHSPRPTDFDTVYDVVPPLPLGVAEEMLIEAFLEQDPRRISDRNICSRGSRTDGALSRTSCGTKG